MLVLCQEPPRPGQCQQSVQPPAGGHVLAKEMIQNLPSVPDVTPDELSAVQTRGLQRRACHRHVPGNKDVFRVLGACTHSESQQ